MDNPIDYSALASLDAKRYGRSTFKIVVVCIAILFALMGLAALFSRYITDATVGIAAVVFFFLGIPAFFILLSRLPQTRLPLAELRRFAADNGFGFMGENVRFFHKQPLSQTGSFLLSKGRTGGTLSLHFVTPRQNIVLSGTHAGLRFEISTVSVHDYPSGPRRPNVVFYGLVTIHDERLSDRSSYVSFYDDTSFGMFNFDFARAGNWQESRADSGQDSPYSVYAQNNAWPDEHDGEFIREAGTLGYERLENHDGSLYAIRTGGIALNSAGFADAFEYVRLASRYLS